MIMINLMVIKMRKFKNKTKKSKIIPILAIILMLINVCCLTIVYSALSSTLNISGEVSIVLPNNYYYRNNRFYTDPTNNDLIVTDNSNEVKTLEVMTNNIRKQYSILYFQNCYEVSSEEQITAHTNILIKRYTDEKNPTNNYIGDLILINGSGSLTLSGSENNKITINGGYNGNTTINGYGINLNQGKLTLKDNIKITNCLGTSGKNGGAIYANIKESDDFKLIGTNAPIIIDNNYSSGNEGAGIYTENTTGNKLQIPISGEIKINNNYLISNPKDPDYFPYEINATNNLKKSNLYLGKGLTFRISDKLKNSKIGIRSLGWGGGWWWNSNISGYNCRNYIAIATISNLDLNSIFNVDIAKKKTVAYSTSKDIYMCILSSS